MAAMSFYSNWDSLHPPPPQQPPELTGAAELFNFQDDPFLQPPNDELICFDNLFSYSSVDINEPHYYYEPYSKRQKYSNLSHFLLPELPPPVRMSVICDEKKPEGVSLSAQSVAARERRRKITEKTQELGKLVPGGNKMNTAEMFQAAYDYVKFLQAQVSILQCMEETKQPLMKNKDLEVLLTSPLIQDKLYSEEKCLVPVEFVQTTVNRVDGYDDQSKDLVDELLNLH